MRRTLKTAVVMAILAASVLFLHADVADNPYAAIVQRNPFGLKDPPPPPPPAQENVPATPPAKVTLTGLISMFGEPQALLEIFDEPGKGGGAAKKPILRQGERMGAVEVVEINVEKNSVRIRNSGHETNLTFEIAKAPAGAAPSYAGGVPAPPPAMPVAGLPGAQGTPPPAPVSSAAVPGSANGGSGVTLMGGGNAATPAAAPSVTAIDPNSGQPTVNAGLRSIPGRPLRTENGVVPPPMTREQAINAFNARRGLPPVPSGAVPNTGGGLNPNQPAPPPDDPNQ